MENAENIRIRLGTRYPGHRSLVSRMANISSASTESEGVAPMYRLDHLNDKVIASFGIPKSTPPKFVPSVYAGADVPTCSDGYPASYRDDELVVVLGAGDRKSNPTKPYVFNVRLDQGDPDAFAGLTLDAVVRYCTSVEPIAAFVPVSAGLSNEPFLVLKTDVMSRNIITSTQRRINGTNVVMCPAEHVSTSMTYMRYTNLTGTVLRPTDPKYCLSTMMLSMLRADGTPVEVPDTSDPYKMPRLVLRLHSRVPRSC